MNSFTKIKGVSLPLVIGMLTVLMISAVSINALIIRALQSSQRIEASSRAYLAAEAGIEDALYELSPHLAGYETSGRQSLFNSEDCSRGSTDAKKWCNDWSIESLSGEETWGGQFFANQKLMIYLFKDENTTNNPGENLINDPANSTINTINPGTFSITFSIPDPATYLDGDFTLRIDNDRDFSPSFLTNVNEDGALEYPIGCSVTNDCTCEANTDCDDDGQINEDSDEDAVILWKLTDGAGGSLIPISGCLSGAGSEICEKEFDQCNTGSADSCSVYLDKLTMGNNQDGDPETVGDFITRSNTINNAELQFEFLIIAPLEHITTIAPIRRIEIPYLEYKVTSDVTDLPLPYFTIRSDGYYGNYKQSLSTRVLPKTTVPLFDFTIIQQQ